LNVFFDVDYTILSYDNGIRPGTHEVFARLVSDGHQIYIWSGQGLRWAEINEHKLADSVTDVFNKPTWNYVARLKELGVRVVPDFVVDDYPEIVEAFGGFCVKEFFRKRHADDEMYAAYKAICEHAQSGTSSHPSYRPRPHALAKGSAGPV
jgi:haloacid dehalogenase-like hydrolase